MIKTLAKEIKESLEELIAAFSWEKLQKDAIYLDNGLFE